MDKIKRVISLVIILVLIVEMFTVPNFASDDVYYIRNNYTTDAYLYEADGVLRYGIPIEGDRYFQWKIEEKGEYKIIRNVATNHCITLKGHADETAEGYWADAVALLDLEEGDDTYLWSFAIGEGQNIVSESKKYQGFALHLENAVYGQVWAQKISSDQLNWGNMKWDFVKEKSINFSSMMRDGFCIQNTETGKYLRVDDGVLSFGEPKDPDNAFIWVIEGKEDGRKLIKNKLTNQYLTLSQFDSTSKAIGLSDNIPDDDNFLWKFQISKETPIMSASSEFKGYGLYHDVEKDRALLGNFNSSNELLPNMKWNFVASTKVANVAGPLIMEDGVYNLKNSWYSMYMIEDNGVAVYGNADLSDPNAQWRMIYDEATGLTALKNEGTGHYLRVDSNNRLVCDSTVSYYWNLKRNSNSLYPNAVQFQDSVNTNSFLHMEGLTGLIENSNAVQPTWGTPHWEPIKVDVNAGAKEEKSIELPKGFVRLKNVKTGAYLYENSSGAVTYGDVKDTDARSHWEIAEGNEPGTFLLKNREYENYITNKGNGTLRCVPEEDLNEGSLWEISVGDESNVLMFRSYNKNMPPYTRPYLNIAKVTGFAQCTLVSNEDLAVQWMIEEAKGASAGTQDEGETKVPINVFPDTNLYRIAHEGKYLDGTYRLEYYGSKIRIIDSKNNKYLYFEDGWKTKSLKENSDASVQWESDSKAGNFGLKQGKTRILLEAVPSDSYYSAKEAYSYKDKLVFTVFVQESRNYKVSVDYSGKKAEVNLAVNGINFGSITLPNKEGTELFLNKGINTITFKDAQGISGITIYETINKSYRGASVTYTQYQAEDCANTGTLIEEDRTYRTLSSEASGRLAVELSKTGQYIKFTLTKPANAMVIRYAIPDSLDGAGLDETLNLYIDGHKSESIKLSSKHSWSYGAYPWTNNPKDMMAHHFYDEVRIMLDKTYPAGTVMKLQKDAANQADYYIIDLIETEEVDKPSEMPENALSITDFGAVPGDGRDDTEAVVKCIENAVKQGKEVWIPEGVFELGKAIEAHDAGQDDTPNRGIVLDKDNVVIRGAGMWHSVLKGENAAFFIKASNISFYDFSLMGAAVSRRDSVDPSAIETDYNTLSMENLTVQNIWIEHYKTGIWTHNLDGLHVVGCRIRNTFADGMNLRRGTSNSIVEQNDVRNTGDDAIAMWSSDFNDTNNKIRFNNVALQWLANNIALYGGKDIEITDNLIMDTVGFGGGINISTNFNPKPFEGTITIARNTLLRCGSFDQNHNYNDGAIWFNTVSGNDNHASVIVRDNLIKDSTYQGISFSNKGTIDNVLIEGNTIDGCGTFGIDIAPGAKGAAIVRNNLIVNAMLDKINNSSNGKFTLTVEVTEETVTNSKSGISPAFIFGFVAFGAVSVFIFALSSKKKGKNQ